MNYNYNDRVIIQSGTVRLNGHVVIPAYAKGIVIFTQGIGSGRMNPSSQKIAMGLNEEGFGTLLFDLLTEQEDKDYFNRFDIELLTSRLISATQWLDNAGVSDKYPLGFYGTGTGAAAALDAAAILRGIQAVVCRSGRPDLTALPLSGIATPVLLITGSLDYDVTNINKAAMLALACPKKMEIVDGASHLFQEPETMDKVSILTNAWFQKYFEPAVYQFAETSIKKIA